MSKRSVKIDCKGEKMVKLDDLIPFQEDLKTLAQEDKEKIKKILLEQGFKFPFFVWKNKDKNYILDGHQREIVLKEMREEAIEIPEEFPVVFIKAKDKREAKKLILHINSKYGKITEEGFIDFLEGLEVDVGFLDTLALPEIDISFIKDEYFTETEENGENVKDDKPGSKKERSTKEREELPPISKPGDLWLLGDHRVFCGDCREVNYIEKFKGEKGEAILTDPPYRMGKEFQGENYTEEEYFNLLYSAFEELTIENSCLVCFQATKGASIKATIKAGEEAGFEFVRFFPMYKPNDETFPWRSWLQKTEAILIFQMGKGSYNEVKPYSHDHYTFNHSGGELNEGEGWHPSIKPLEVVKDLLQRVTTEGAIVYDPFLGSGTTLLAAEESGRKCYGIEIEPKFVDVVIRRWQNKTGKEAVLCEKPPDKAECSS